MDRDTPIQLVYHSATTNQDTNHHQRVPRRARLRYLASHMAPDTANEIIEVVISGSVVLALLCLSCYGAYRLFCVH